MDLFWHKVVSFLDVADKFSEILFQFFFDGQSKREKVFQSFVHDLKDILFNEIQDWETSKGSQHREVLVDIDVDAIKVFFFVFFFLGDCSFIRFTTCSVGCTLFLSILNFNVSFKICWDDENNIGHFENILIGNVLLDIEINRVTKLHQTTFQGKTEISQS